MRRSLPCRVLRRGGPDRGRPEHRVEADLRSDKQFLGVERSLQRAWAKGAGLIDEEFERPMVAVVNTYQDFSPRTCTCVRWATRSRRACAWRAERHASSTPST